MKEKDFVNESRDIRFEMALKPGLYTFGKETSSEKYRINSIIGFGGSSITYDVTFRDMPSFHYALKEFYPLDLADYAYRNNGNIVVDEQIVERWNKRRDDFLSEVNIQRKLPFNNSKAGRLFIYSTERFFCANNTAYILYSTEYTSTLADRIKVMCSSENNKKNNENIKFFLNYMVDVCNAVSELHRSGILHLDISDTNIFVSENHAKLSDFGSAIEINEAKKGIKTTTYSPAFSPIEQKGASQGHIRYNINEQTDIYAICAVMYKCIFGEIYDPIYTKINYSTKDRMLYEPPKIVFGITNKVLIWEIIDILKDGLCGNEFRYKSSDELRKKIERLIRKIERVEKDKKFSKHVAIIVASTFVIIILTVMFGFNVIQEPPKLDIVSPIDSIYSNGETLEFELVLYDSMGLSDNVTRNCVDSIKTIGFSGDKRAIIDPDSEDDCSIVFRVIIDNLEASEFGNKTIEIGNIYKRTVLTKALNLGKWNEHKTLNFEFVKNSISCSISEPTFTKVNSNSGHDLKYYVSFNSSIDFQTDLVANNIKTYGFSCDKIDSRHIRDNEFELTFNNIVGDVGAGKYIIIHEGVATSNDGKLYSKKAISPSFEIVEQKVSNYPIYLNAFSESQDIRDGGYILLEWHNQSGQYSNPFDESFISLNGFSADIHFPLYGGLRNYILLDNLKIIDINAMSVEFKEGALVSRENGSRSQKIIREISSSNSGWYARSNSISPVLAIMQYGTKPVHDGNDIIIYATGDDDESCFVNRTKDFYLTKGFSYEDCEINIYGLNILAIFKNVRITDSEPTVSIKKGTFVDLFGNESEQLDYKIKIE